MQSSQDAQGLRPETATFLFTDIEASTKLLQSLGDDFPAVLERHHELLHEVVAAKDGVVRRTEGDSFFATFTAASSAVSAATEAQRRFAEQIWPADNDVRIRIGVHTGEAIMADFEIVGLDVHRAARIMAAGWGGQVLISQATRGQLPDDSDLVIRDLGEHRLKDLASPEHLFQVTIPGMRADFPPVRSLDRVTNNLPTQLTPFIGRAAEIDQVATLLEQSRLVTLTGPGGTGKTRLSIEVARHVLDRFDDGVFFVALAATTEPELVWSAVASSIGLLDNSGRTPSELVIDHLRDRTCLLVLDNLEQVLGAGPSIAKLVADGPELRVVTSSRAPLRVYGEQEYPVPPLTTPRPPEPEHADDLAGNEAVILFVARAAAISPGFRLTDENAAAVAEITRRLDGLPLAIELAAARTRLLPPEGLVQRLGNRLDLLSSGAADLPDRQRTLRGAIDWSHDLLEPAAQDLFARMGVFVGGADLDQIEAVCTSPGADLLLSLGDLVDHSLVQRAAAGERSRFAMLETLRAYADEKLAASGEAPAQRDRHLRAYLELAREAAGQLTGEQRAQWLDRLEQDHDNLRAAMAWAIEQHRVGDALELAASTWRMWQMRGHLHEARRVMDQVLALEGVHEHPDALLGACEAAGGIAYWLSDLPTARRHYEQALELSREGGHAATIARQLYNLAFAYPRDTGRDEAMALLQQALDCFEGLGDRQGVARAHWGLATLAMYGLDFDQSVLHGQQALSMFRESDDAHDLTWALHMVGLGHYALGNPTAAHPLFAEALERFRLADDRTGLYLVLSDFALLAEAAGRHAEALRLFGTVERLSDETGSTLLDDYLHVLPRPITSHEAVDETERDRLLDEGRRMPLEDAIALAEAWPTSPP